MKTILSQNKAIEKDLRRGRKITPLQALRDYGCLRLSGRIYDLKQQGLKIKSQMIYEHPYKYAQYKLAR